MRKNSIATYIMVFGILLIICGILFYSASNYAYQKQKEAFNGILFDYGVVDENLNNQMSGSLRDMSIGISMAIFGFILICVGVYVYAKPEGELKRIFQVDTKTITNTTSDKNKNASKSNVKTKDKDVIHVLNIRYAKGEITKEQYDQMKKDISDKS